MEELKIEERSKKEEDGRGGEEMEMRKAKRYLWRGISDQYGVKIPVRLFVFVLCEQMNLAGSDKVVIKNNINGSRFVVSSSWTHQVELCASQQKSL